MDIDIAYMRQIVLGLLCLLCFSSCRIVLLRAIGVKNNRHLSEEKIAKLQHRYGIDSRYSYYTDTIYNTYLAKTINKKDSAERGIYKTFSQPLIATYYIQKPTADMAIVNCDGYMKMLRLTWNKHGEMDVFPPKYDTLHTNKIKLQEYLQCLKPLKGSAAINTIAGYDNVIVLHWVHFFTKNTKSLIKEVERNAKLAKGKTLIVYVNADNVYDTSK